MTKRFAVRPVRPRDLDRIEVIEAASFGTDAYDRKLFADYTRVCGGLFLVAQVGTKVIGYSITALPARWAGERAELVSVAVDPAYLGKGAAAAMLESTFRRLRRRHVTRLALTVKVTNLRARAFYDKYGFRKRRSAPGYYEDGEDGILLFKDLHSTN